MSQCQGQTFMFVHSVSETITSDQTTKIFSLLSVLIISSPQLCSWILLLLSLCVHPIPYIALYKHWTWKSPTKRWLWCINFWSHNNICTFVLYVISRLYYFGRFVHFVENEKFSIIYFSSFFFFAKMRIYFLSLFFMI